MILKQIFSLQEPMSGGCKHVNEPSVSMRCGKSLDELGKCQLLKRDSALYGQLIIVWINLRLQRAKSCKVICVCTRSVTQWRIIFMEIRIKIQELQSIRGLIRESLKINQTARCARLVIVQSCNYRAKAGQLLSRVKCQAISALMTMTQLQDAAPA